MAKDCTLSTGKLPLGGLPSNSVVRINDHPNMTSAVYRGRKATNKMKIKIIRDDPSDMTTAVYWEVKQQQDTKYMHLYLCISVLVKSLQVPIHNMMLRKVGLVSTL